MLGKSIELLRKKGDLFKRPFLKTKFEIARKAHNRKVTTDDMVKMLKKNKYQFKKVWNHDKLEEGITSNPC